MAWGVKSPPGEPEIDLKEKIKSAGLAGVVAYAGTELAFWIISIPLAIVGYYETTGEWLDLTTLEGKEQASGLWPVIHYVYGLNKSVHERETERKNTLEGLFEFVGSAIGTPQAVSYVLEIQPPPSCV